MTRFRAISPDGQRTPWRDSIEGALRSAVARNAGRIDGWRFEVEHGPDTDDTDHLQMEG